MDFIWNHIQNLIEHDLLNEKNPNDMSYMLMLNQMDDMRDVVAAMFEIHVHTHSLSNNGEYKYVKRDMLCDFEIDGINIEASKNARIRGGHVKTSSYHITCQTDLTL